MHNRPLPGVLDPDRNGFHFALARGLPVTRLFIDVPAPQAEWTVVPVGRTGSINRDHLPAVGTAEFAQLLMLLGATTDVAIVGMF